MKVYIYDQFITDDELKIRNLFFAQRDQLHPHLEYLHDIYNLLKKYQTHDAEEADFFFIPLFMTGWQFSNLDPFQLIEKECKFLNKKRHVIVSTADFGQREESQYEMTHDANPNRAYDQKFKWLDDRFSLIVLESMNSLHSQDVAILPYQQDDIIISNDSNRDILASFAGKMIQAHLPITHIRGGRLYELREIAFDFVIGSLDEVSDRLGNRLSYRDLMSRSVFTLCPAGYGRWTFRMIESLLCGSIPVILSDDYVLPFADKIDWSKYVIVVPENDLLKLPEILKSISSEKIKEMQQNIFQNKHLFQKDFILSCMLEKLDVVDHGSIAIGKMRGPEHMHIICIDVTNKCDLACSNCTRLLKNQDSLWEMTPDNFREALRSLKNYRGVIAMIGGNPCTHSKFEEMCAIFREEIPNQFQRGLWTNNYFKHREVIEKTFGALNLNPHNVERANEPLKDLYQVMVKNRGFNGGYYVGNSVHAPLLTAIRDLYPEAEMWERISRCDINREWSATIIQNQNKLRAYFCEVAASFDLSRNTDFGIPVTLDWWKRPIVDFASQIRKFCPGCGAAARQKPTVDANQIDTYTKTNADIALKSKEQKNRKIEELVSNRTEERRITQYYQ